MSRSHRRLILLALVLGAAAALIWYANRPQPVAVLVQAVERGPVEQTVANTRAGTVTACRRAKLSPSIGGQISVLDIEEGDTVEAGQLLLELWNEDLEAQVELATSEAKAAEARAQAACAEAEVAQREARRARQLVKDKLTSEEQADAAITRAKSRRAQCEAALASANVSRAQVKVATARLTRTRLTAPFAGVVAEITGELNEYTTPSPPGIPTPPAIDLIDNSCYYVLAPIDEVDAPAIRLDMPVRITLDAFGDHAFEGRVRRIGAYVLDVEKQARTVDVEAEFIHAEDIERLLAGYSADVEVILDVEPETLRIPTEALLDDERVLVLAPLTGLLEERTIRTGLSNWDQTEVLEGLEAGERVVVSLDRTGVEAGARAVIDDAAQ
jgi:HlyD family secretion protein